MIKDKCPREDQTPDLPKNNDIRSIHDIPFL